MKSLSILSTVTTASLFIAACGNSNDTSTATTLPVSVSTIEITSRDHIEEDLEYPESPPLGGDHYPVWQNCGIYRDPIVDELAVHSLEHGAVWITYRPDLPPADIAALEAYTNGQTHILVSPYPDLPAPIVASAWGAQQRFEAPSDAGLEAFITAFQQGPQTPDLGATCSRGYGEPA